ncbi:MAG: hypothetical protein ACP5JH_09345 [Bacteroidota bacterium]
MAHFRENVNPETEMCSCTRLDAVSRFDPEPPEGLSVTFPSTELVVSASKDSG